MNYQRYLGLALMLLGLDLDALLTLLTHNAVIGVIIGMAVGYIGWRIRWSA